MASKMEGGVLILDHLAAANRFAAEHKQMLEALENLENDDGSAMPDTAWAMVQDAIEFAGGKRKDG